MSDRTKIEDPRVVYGALCTWWDSIKNVGGSPMSDGMGSLPVCPHCGSPLFEFPTEVDFLKGADDYEANGNPGYKAMLLWARGKCFPNVQAMTFKYRGMGTGGGRFA